MGSQPKTADLSDRMTSGGYQKLKEGCCEASVGFCSCIKLEVEYSTVKYEIQGWVQGPTKPSHLRSWRGRMKKVGPQCTYRISVCPIATLPGARILSTVQ